VYLPVRQIPAIKRSNVVVAVAVVVVVAMNPLRGPRVLRLRRGNIMVDRGLTLAVLPPSPRQGTAITYATRSTAPTTPTRTTTDLSGRVERKRERRAQRLCSLLRDSSYTCRGHILIGDAWPPVQSTGTVGRLGPAGFEEARGKKIWHTGQSRFSTLVSSRHSILAREKIRGSEYNLGDEKDDVYKTQFYHIVYIL